MSTIKKPRTSPRSRTQQSDITISADGTISISFLWDDLRDLAGDLSPAPAPVPAQWTPPLIHDAFSTLEYVSCLQCPKQCGFNRNRYAHPTCGDAKLRVSNVGLSFGDEEEIKGQGGSGAIMLSGCPLTCPSCHNPEKVASGAETSPEQFLQYCKDLLDQGAENIQILSPTVHLPNLRFLLKLLKDSGFPLPIVFKSSGYENVDEIKKLAGLVDVYLPDFKFGPCSSWGVRAGVKDYFERAKEALQEMILQVGSAELSMTGAIKKGVLIRHVLAPLPAKERGEILDLLSTFTHARLSIQDTFVDLE